MCVCVCVCVNIAPRIIDLLRSNSTSTVLLQISQAFLSFPHIPIKLTEVLISKKFKILIFFNGFQRFQILWVYRPNTFGVKGDWDFRISDLVKNPDGTYI